MLTIHNEGLATTAKIMIIPFTSVEEYWLSTFLLCTMIMSKNEKSGYGLHLPAGIAYADLTPASSNNSDSHLGTTTSATTNTPEDKLQ